MVLPSSGKVVAIHQPNYLPWLGYFYKIHKSDFFVFLDDVQFSNEGMHNYTYIKTSNGSYRLKYPVHQSFGDRILEVRPNDAFNWKDKHLRLIDINYREAKYFRVVFDDYKSILMRDYPDIVALNTSLIKFYTNKLGFHVNFLNSSELGIKKVSSDKLVSICKALDANIYYSGVGAKVYQDEDSFLSSGIMIEYSDYTPFIYPQLWIGFQQNVSALDFFMNCGYDWDLVIKNQNRK